MDTGLGSRAAALERLAATRRDPLDLLVVGGGITGAGIALDAAARGLRVGLVERHDFASGTSSRSSKLVHGGLRYLEQREFGLVREASVERALLTRLAPHLVQPIPFVIPVSSRWRRAQFGVGLWAYDALASFRNIRFHRYLSREETEALVPALPRGKVRGGMNFYDARTDDVRLVMEVLIQARRHGAIVANYARVVALGTGDVCAATVEDGAEGGTFEVHARRVIVAAGVWADRIERLIRPGADERLRPSKGIHLVFRPESIPMAGAAAFIPDAARRRMLFVVPWIDSVLVGTTDTGYAGDLDTPGVTAADRAYVLDAVNSAFELSLGPDDVAGAYAGLRPLIAGKRDETADLSRRHVVYDIAPGVIGITGGKLTTYRRMAIDAVDRAADGLGVPAESRTDRIKLGSTNVANLTNAVAARASRLRVTAGSAANLVRCYGDRALEVLEIAAQEGSVEALAPDGLPIAAEAAYCARAEMVVHLDDLLARRTRLALTDPAAGMGAGSRAAELLGSALGWDATEVEAEIVAHRHGVEQERGAALSGYRDLEIA